MTTTREARERMASRLLVASARRSYDSTVDIDWAAPMPEKMYHWPPERMSLYGTPWWDQLSAEDRVLLSQHEAASIAAAGIWFEMFAIQMLVRYAYPRDPGDAHTQYVLTETGDECRHIVMFGRAIARGGAPAYRLGRVSDLMGRFVAHTSRGASLLAAILTIEEITDMFQRETMVDERVQPLVREVGRIHVVEEARHVQWARDEVIRLMARTNPLSRELHRFVMAGAAMMVARSLVSPRVYDAVNLPRRRARRAALRNPTYQATLRWSASKIVPYLMEVGLIGGPSKLVWRHAHLL